MKFRSAAFFALTIATLGALAHAAPSSARLNPRVNTVVKVAPTSPALTTKSVAIAPQLQPTLQSKKTFDPNLVKISYVGNTPQLHLSASKSVMLEPTNLAAPRYVPVDPQLRGQYIKYLPHISSRYWGKAQISKLIDVAVDSKAWQTPIKDQGSRGTCVAFASMAGIEQYYKKSYNITANLSENHAYNIFMSRVGSTCMADPGIATVNAPDYLRGTDLVCAEEASPYVNNTTSACASVPTACTNTRRHGITNAAKFFSPTFGGTGDEVATNTSYLEALVKLGFPVVLGVYVAGSDWSDGSAESGVIDLQKTSSGQPAGAVGGHAMLLVGYNATKNYFIFKNSWGTDRGHDGYFHLSYEYLQTYAKYGYVIFGVNDPR